MPNSSVLNINSSECLHRVREAQLRLPVHPTCRTSYKSLTKCGGNCHCRRHSYTSPFVSQGRVIGCWELRAGMCFDAACQQSQDKAFLLSILIPVIVGSVLVLSKTLRKQEASGISQQDDQFEVDSNGNIVFTPISYTPWPMEKGSSGTKLRISVGPLGGLVKQTFSFNRLKPKSEILAVSLPRPMGLVFAEDKRAQRVIVDEVLTGSPAYQQVQRAKLDSKRRADAVFEGDILRACTCTNFVYQTNALFGAQPPTRTIVLYGADNQKWPEVMNALKRGEKTDGEVTLVVEREI